MWIIQIWEKTKKSQNKVFNILIYGPALVEKSAFIKQFLKENSSKEGEDLFIIF